MVQKFGILKILLRTILILISLPVLYFSTALLLSIIGTNPEKFICPEPGRILITSNGVHLDIILPVEVMEEPLLQKLSLPGEISFISFGWGDKAFYLNTPEWDDLTFKTAFNALFLKSETAMHVSWFNSSDQEWIEIELCPEQLLKLNEYIYNSFDKKDGGEFIKIDAPGYFRNDCFFEARGTYSLFRTCNNWSNKALKSANIPTAIWSPFDFGILFHFN